MYGSMDLFDQFDEQVVDSFHQVVKGQLRILAAVPKDKLLETLFTRCHNISEVNVASFSKQKEHDEVWTREITRQKMQGK